MCGAVIFILVLVLLPPAVIGVMTYRWSKHLTIGQIRERLTRE